MKIGQQILLISLCICSAGLCAQDVFELQSNMGAIKVAGTSSIHNWEMDVLEASGSATFQAGESKLMGIDSMQMTFSTAQIISGNNVMDKKTRKALNSEVYPEISFKMTSADDFSYNDESFTGLVTGILSINGHTESIKVPFSGTYSGNQIVVKGSQSILLTDFDIAPPTAMMGTLKTGDRVEIIFDTVWKYQGSISASL